MTVRFLLELEGNISEEFTESDPPEMGKQLVGM
jgi:hypothetical protein